MQYDTHTQNMIKAMTYQYPDEIPLKIWIMPAAWFQYGDEINRLKEKYPHLLGDLQEQFPYMLPTTYQEGKHVDAWGCVWENIEEGYEAIVTGHPIPNREGIASFAAPAVDTGLPHGFMYLRLLDLRGFEEAMIDFAEEPPELQMLIDKVLQYNLTQIDKALQNDPSPILYFGDDLGMQTGLAIGAEKWRKYLKPCYETMYRRCRDAGKYVYMHTDGQIYEIMPDLQEAGVDMINPQFRANGLDNLVRVCKGKIPICLDLDRQLFPFATPDELYTHVRQAVEALYLPEGGLALNIEFGVDVPVENMDAILAAVDEFRFYRG